ncbi:unnamed protein product [Angiostrongylus costaricensis]|uniref:Uncharacterized protein n=1 Tax=Angiostrongylus costaricensis TaxID=334426 RepID=A0A0R3PYZ1_ANGCS|nr:unnamed protein product [Angiostrongylus costaricensis]
MFLEQPTVDRSQPRTLVGKATNDNIIMNDIMMDEIIGEDKAEDVDTVIEDAVSISTDVVEEVDEVELSRLQLQSEPRPFEKRCNCLEDEKHLAISETKDDESSQASSLEYPSTSKTDQNSIELKKDSTDVHVKVYEKGTTDKDNSDLEEDDTADAGPSSTAKKFGPNSAMKEASTNSTTSKAGESEAESEEEVIIDVVQLDVQPNSPAKNIETLDPSLIAPKSIMYADTSSDEISDEEESHETMPPIQRSQGIVNIHEESTTVTTIMLGVDSHPSNQFSSVAVKMNFDAREAMTDEEFSEKLI